ncbi:MAG: homoserine O-succinyltransferase [Gemmatimonadota bacterium]
MHRQARRSEIPAIELFGTAEAPVVVALGGISSSAHVGPHAGNLHPGWWGPMVGEGRPLDTTRARIMGMSYGVFSPGPTTTQDQARALARALDACGIATVRAIVGASYGGMIGLAFAELFPERVERLVAISAPHQSHPLSTALRVIQRKIIRLGITANRRSEGVALARALGMTSYRTAEEFAARFTPLPESEREPRSFPVEDYLDHCGEKFAQQFPPGHYLGLSESLDLHRVDPRRITVPTTVVAVASDTLVPPSQLQELVEQLAGPVVHHQIPSRYGHDAFLKEIDVVGRIVAESLALEVAHAS